MDAAPPQPNSLEHLPPELLSNIWEELQWGWYPNLWPGTQGDATTAQQMLRCCSRALRDATTRYIHTLNILLTIDTSEVPWDELLNVAAARLSRFPKAATLTQLRWECRWSGDGEAPEHYGQPILLPSFMHMGASRLAAVTCVKITGCMALGYGELAAIANTCPALHDLELQDVTLTGPALAPLANLQALKQLTLRTVYAAHTCMSLLAESLAALTRLEYFYFNDDWHYDDGGQLDCSPLLVAVLPYIRHLTALTSLQLKAWHVTGSMADSLFEHVSALRRLRCLNVAVPYLPPPPIGRAPSWLPFASSLEVLDLHSAKLGTAAIRLVATLPRLERLEVLQLNPDTDLSGQQLPSSCFCVRMFECTSPRQLAWSPLGSVRMLGTGDIQWMLKLNSAPINTAVGTGGPGSEGSTGGTRGTGDPPSAVQALCGEVRRAAEILADKWCDPPHRLRLGQDTSGIGPEPGGASDTAMPFMRDPTTTIAYTHVPAHSPADCAAASAVIAALAPLRRQHFMLHLERSWPLDAEQARQLSQHLPLLQELYVAPCTPGFPAFAAALAASSPLPELHLMQVGYAQAPPPEGMPPRMLWEARLTALAVGRVASGRDLTIVDHGLLMNDERDRLNESVQAHRETRVGGVSGKVVFACGEVRRDWQL